MQQAVAELDQPLPAAHTPSSGQSDRPIILAYAVTIFTSAFLLFQVQPLISKFILPWFGGSPAVWTAAMLFFQVALFGGYLYAHLASTYLGPRGQFVLHLALLATAAVLAIWTHVTPSEGLKPRGDEASPLLQILLVLGTSVGLPYFALSSTGPLLQKWFSDAFAGASPYRLFALSNVGSLLALLSYPFFFEVYWDLSQQAAMWAVGFLVFAGCCGFCAWWTYRARAARVQVTAMPGVMREQRREEAQGESLPIWRRLAWVALPALASVMFLSVTNEVCQNVATVPLLWIIPLSIYLISFIVAFDHPRWYVRPVCAVGAMLLVVFLADFHGNSGRINGVLNSLPGRANGTAIDVGTWLVHCSAYFGALLLVCLICHCELAHLKPQPRYLTGYFLSMSLGGAVGGILVNIAAPHLFRTFFELPLAMLASLAIAAGALVFAVQTRGRAATGAALAFGALALLAFATLEDDFRPPRQRPDRKLLYEGRNFFGLVAVQLRSLDKPELANATFWSGHIAHGRQFLDPAKRSDTHLAYWGEGTGCRRALDYAIKKHPACRIGVIGLGVGTIAAFADDEQDYLRMYEINPEVVEIAKQHFHFLEDCPAKQDIVVGDARLQLERELKETGSHHFDVLCIDAFSGDAVPSHLLTTEAFAVYKQHLKPDGLIIANITNTYLDLYPVVKRLAEEHGFKHTRIYRPSEKQGLVYRSYYMMITNDGQFLSETAEEISGMPASLRRDRSVPLWTDRYHSLFQILQ